MFTNRKIIETESVNCDDSLEDNNPDFWLDCEFKVKHIDKTREYTFDCGEEHKIEDLVRKLAKIENCEIGGISWMKQG